MKSLFVPFWLVFIPACRHTAIIFDHSNQVTASAEVYKSLVKRGFHTDGDVVNHPGQRTCEFIKFRSENGASMQYLEFIYHNPALPKDQIVVGESPREYWNGLSFRASKNLQKFYEDNKAELATFKPAFEHKNYDWAKDSSSRLPGWNFLSFENEGVPGISVWITEYEPRPDMKKEKLKITHPNGSRRIAGFLWKDLSAQQQSDLAKISGGMLEGDKLVFADGLWIRFLDQTSPLMASFQSKTTPYAAVIIEVESLKIFKEMAKPDAIVTLDGQEAALLRLSDSAWDIIALERNGN